MANPIATVLSVLNISMCVKPPKFKESKDGKREWKEFAKFEKFEAKELKREKFEAEGTQAGEVRAEGEA